MWTRRVLSIWLMVGVGALAVGCVAFIDEPPYPVPPPTAPRLLAMSLNPTQIPVRSGTNRITVTLDYEDLDGDVDRSGATLEFKLSSTTYEIRGASEVRKPPDDVEKDPAGAYIRGRIISSVGIDTSDVYQPGSFTLTAILIDKAGHRSNGLQGTIRVVSRYGGGGGGGGSSGGGCRIWFTDGPQGPPTTLYRIGQQVFLMAEDTSIGVLKVRFVTATLRNEHDAWSTPITLYQTGQQYVFASSIGPRLGFDVPAHSGDTLTAFYTAYADPNDTCLALAKVR